MLRLGLGISLAAVPLMLALSGCPGSPSGEGEGEGEGAGEGEGSPGEGEGSPGEGEGSTGEGEGEGVSGEGEGEGGGGGFSCTTGGVFLGDPNDPNPDQRPSDGQPAHQAPFMPYGNMIFTGNTLIVHDQLVIWSFDTTAANPTLHKIAGDEPTDAFSATQALITGPCASSRFGTIQDLDFLSDGSIIVADAAANAILKITSPLDPTNCTVSHFAGTATDQAEGSFGGGSGPPQTANLTTDPNNPVDGPVATATFSSPEQIVIDSNDVVYVHDGRPDLTGSDFLRKIDNGQVSTIAKHISNGGLVGGIAIRNDKVAFWAYDFVQLYLTEVDPNAAAPATLECHTQVTSSLPCPANSSDDGLGECVCNSGFGGDGAGGCVAGPCTDLLRGDQSILDGAGGGSIDVGGMGAVPAGYLVWLTGGVWFVDATTHATTQVAGVYSPGIDFDSTTLNTQFPALEILTPASTGRSHTLGSIADVSLDATGNLYISTELQGSYVTKVNCTE